MKRYYLAYGSNLNIAQMQFRCPDATVVGTAVIPDYELLFKGSLTGAYLTICICMMQCQGISGNDNHQNKKHRHHALGYPFNTTLNAIVNTQRCYAHK